MMALRTKQVLIAEDNDDLRRIFARVFQDYDFTVTSVADGQLALEHLMMNVPDVVILDINMPHLSGFDLLAYIRKSPDLIDTKVIVVTGNSQAMQDEKIKQADLVLLKPINLQELIMFAMRLAP
jgi:CheY-like chemotaxis protein